MAINYTNDYKNILDKLESIIESEFKGALPVYKGSNMPQGMNQGMQIIPLGDTLSEYTSTSELREYSFTLRYVFAEANVNEKVLDHILAQVSRIKYLIKKNMSMQLSDNSHAVNCRIDSTELIDDEEVGVHITEFDYKCQHLIVTS